MGSGRARRNGNTNVVLAPVGLCALRRLTRLIPALAHVLASELKVLQSLTQKEKWEQATLANNFIFYKVMRHHPEACKHLLEMLLKIKIEQMNMRSEETIELDYDAKGIRLDVFVKDTGRMYDRCPLSRISASRTERQNWETGRTSTFFMRRHVLR